MTLSRRTTALASAIALAIGLAQPLACRAIAGVDDRGETCGGGLAMGACGVCESERCCTYASACNARADCSQFRECIGGCRASDELCRGRCANDHPEGASAATALRECAVRQCSDRCGSWSCIGKVVWPQAPGSVTFTAKLNDALDSHSLEGVKVTSCSFANPDCQGNEVARTDANGAVKITMPTPRDGWLRVSGNESKVDGGVEAEGYNGLIFFAPPVSDDGSLQNSSILTIAEGRRLAASLLRPDFTATAGVIIITTRDCDGINARGVSFDVSPRGPEVFVAYIDGVLPNANLEETTDMGVAGIGPIPGNTIVTVTARSNIAGKQMGARQVYVQPGFVTYLTMPPMPDRFP